jgi:hypothetical protein
MSLTGLKDLLRKCEEMVAILDEISRELDDMEVRLRLCSWRLTSLRDEAIKVEEVGGVSLRKTRLDKAPDLLGKASARLLKLSEMNKRGLLQGQGIHNRKHASASREDE